MALRRVLAVLGLLLVLAIALAQPRAWRDIDFGDPLLIVANKLVAHDDVTDGAFSLKRSVEAGWTTPEAIIRWGSPKVTIGGQRYTLRFSWYDGRLYQMAFVSDSYDASYFDTHVQTSLATLVDLIATAHGPAPQRIDVGFLDLHNGFVSWTHRWPTNSDGAAYDIGLGSSDFHYYALLSLEWTWLREQYETALGINHEGDVRDAADDF